MNKEVRLRRAARRYWAAKPKARRAASAGTDRTADVATTILTRHPADAADAGTLGPYETAYDIRRGYEEKRSVQP